MMRETHTTERVVISPAELRLVCGMPHEMKVVAVEKNQYGAVIVTFKRATRTWKTRRTPLVWNEKVYDEEVRE